MRRDSSILYSTAARRPFLLSSLQRIQGAVSSIYLLVRETSFIVSVMAFWNWKASICASTLCFRTLAIWISSTSMGSVVCSAGSLPSKYFRAMVTVRETRLPRSLARSVLIRLISSSLVKLPSEPKGNSRNRKYRTASTLYRWQRMAGSTTLPRLLLIFSPLKFNHPWP